MDFFFNKLHALALTMFFDENQGGTTPTHVRNGSLDDGMTINDQDKVGNGYSNSHYSENDTLRVYSSGNGHHLGQCKK